MVQVARPHTFTVRRIWYEIIDINRFGLNSHSIFHTVAPVQRFSSHGPPVDEIGPPASFNQLPHPEGDWADNHAKKQRKYNLTLAASVVFFTGTLVFVSWINQQIHLVSLIFSDILTYLFCFIFQMKESGIIFFNASPPDTYE